MFEELEEGRRVLLEMPISRDSTMDIAVLDSFFIQQQIHQADQACSCCAAMLVPCGREEEWIFSSEGGQWQLLASSGASRLVLMTRKDFRGRDDDQLQEELRPLATALAPKACFGNGPPDVAFLRYDDGVIWRRVVETVDSTLLGSMLVEDIKLEKNTEEMRRRLVFKSTPNLIQTEVLLLVGKDGTLVNHAKLVHVYLAPLVAGFSLVSSGLEKWIATGRMASIVCVGTGGGALPMFLSTQLDGLLRVRAVDIDEAVVALGRKHFGLLEANNLEVSVEDGLSTVTGIADKVCRHQGGGGGGDDARVHVIIVDVTSGDAKSELSSPPAEFVGAEFLTAARVALHEGGMLAMNVMPGGGGGGRKAEAHEAVLDSLAEIFDRVYQLPVSDGENYAVFALISSSSEALADNAVSRQVRSIIDARLVAQICRVRG